jgi:glycosyltransferase involved in cell wall biosynthesis
MGEAGRRRFEDRFSAEVTVGRIDDLYRSLLKERRSE